MFGFLSMLYNYDDRKVDRFEGENGLIVDTCSVTDSTKPYETAICHNDYNGGKWIIVELYDTEEDAQTGHNTWVEIMTSETLPEQLVDVSTCEFALLLDNLGYDSRVKQYSPTP